MSQTNSVSFDKIIVAEDAANNLSCAIALPQLMSLAVEK
jgi:hypothetical protein